MDWATIFGLTNLVAVAGWIALIALPRRPLTHSLILFACVGLLCLAYSLLLGLIVGKVVDPGLIAEAEPYDAANYSIEGLRGIFMSDGGMVLGWTHFLAFDLFVGLWIARDADAKGFSRWVQLPFFVLTFLAGPVGLLLWLAVRDRRARAVARATT